MNSGSKWRKRCNFPTHAVGAQLNRFMDFRGRSTPDAFIALERFGIEDAASVDYEGAAFQ